MRLFGAKTKTPVSDPWRAVAMIIDVIYALYGMPRPDDKMPLEEITLELQRMAGLTRERGTVRNLSSIGNVIINTRPQ